MFFLILVVLVMPFTSAMPTLPPELHLEQSQNSIDSYMPGVLLVKAGGEDSTHQESVLASARTSIGATVAKDYSAEGFAGLQLIKLPEIMSVNDAVAYYSAIPGIEYAEPDYFRTNTIIPNDPDLFRQWGLLNTGQIYKENTNPGIPGADIHAPQAWNTSTKSQVPIAVLDSGVDYLHADLSNNTWTNTATGTHGYDAITGTLDPMDLASHGTHCAGIIGAVGNNGIGGSGVNWNATILPVRFLNSFGTGTVSDEIEAILWAERNGARIFSCSFGGKNPSQAEYEIIAETDGLFICGAGNNGQDNDVTPLYPTSYDLENIISVAATNAQDELASFSNYGKKSVDIGAPGEAIYSTKHNLYTPEPIWRDSFDTLNNWTIHGNWTLDTEDFISPPSSARGTVNNTVLNQTQPTAIISLKEPLAISNLTNPIISYQLQMVGAYSTFSIEASNDNLTWKTLEYDRKQITLLPWIYRESKIPTDMKEAPLYIRFVADGTFIACFLDDITLSDGYGALTETRYGYMDGTSMAVPFISGMAGFLITYAPDDPYSAIKDAILKTVDPVQGLENKTTTGGRANLSAALTYLKKPDTDTINLYPGWNHVSVAKKLISGNDTAYDLFGKVTNTSGHSVLRYYNTSWITVPADETITPLSSYWIWTGMTQNITPLPDLNQNGTYSKNLSKGWNGFGVLGTDSESAKTRLTPIGNTWTYLIGYDSKNQQYEEPIIRDGTGNQSDSRNLLPWHGYWLYVTDNVTYLVTN